MVQWSGLRASTAGDMGLIPGWGTKITHAAMWPKKEKKSHNEIPLHTSLKSKIKEWQYQVLARMWSNWNSQWESKTCKHFGKHFGHFKNQLNYILTIWIIPGYLSKRKENNVSIQRSVHKCSYSFIYNSSKQEAAQLFTDTEWMHSGATLW